MVQQLKLLSQTKQAQSTKLREIFEFSTLERLTTDNMDVSQCRIWTNLMCLPLFPGLPTIYFLHGPFYYVRV